jgi:hypothetical protein
LWISEMAIASRLCDLHDFLASGYVLPDELATDVWMEGPFPESLPGDPGVRACALCHATRIRRFCEAGLRLLYLGDLVWVPAFGQFRGAMAASELFAITEVEANRVFVDETEREGILRGILRLAGCGPREDQNWMRERERVP